jgi:hypothetical protein
MRGGGRPCFKASKTNLDYNRAGVNSYDEVGTVGQLGASLITT